MLNPNSCLFCDENQGSQPTKTKHKNKPHSSCYRFALKGYLGVFICPLAFHLQRLRPPISRTRQQTSAAEYGEESQVLQESHIKNAFSWSFTSPSLLKKSS